MKKIAAWVFLFCATGVIFGAEDTRTIHFKQSLAQQEFADRLYILKHVKATDIVPYISAAILRYDANSTVQRVKYTDRASGEALIVSCPIKMLPYVDDIIAKIDRPGRVDQYGSTIEGTGISRIAYAPEYRSALRFPIIVEGLIASPDGSVYVNEMNNTIFWKDEHNSALDILKWVKLLDRPLPQAVIKLNYYEVRESDLRDIGFDYLAWKNGPGVNFLNVGYNGGKLIFDEVFKSLLYSAANVGQVAGNFSGSWGLGGFFTAPQIDFSFIRLLQQSGNANVAAHATLTMVNTPIENLADFLEHQKNPKNYTITMTPEYQTIAKTNEGRTWIGYYDDEPELTVTFRNPVICFAQSRDDVDSLGFIPTSPAFYHKPADLPRNGGIIFRYFAKFKNVVERGDTGSQLTNSTTVDGALTLGFKNEKILAVYEKENDVRQTIGLPFLSKIPVAKYLFSTTTTIKERNYIVLTAEAELAHPDSQSAGMPESLSSSVVAAKEEVK